jgi:hypothetical protein
MEYAAKLDQATVKVQPQTDTVVAYTDAVVIPMSSKLGRLSPQKWIPLDFLSKGNAFYTLPNRLGEAFACLADIILQECTGANCLPHHSVP